MKKIMKTMLALVAGAMALSACSSDEILESQEQQATGNMTFTAEFSDDEGEATRTSIQSDGSVLWQNGDQISVFSDADAFTANYMMSLTKGAGSTTASFTGKCEKANQEYYAVYPYNQYTFCKTINLRGCRIHWNGATQTAVKDSFDPKTPMMARVTDANGTDTNVPLKFKNILALIKLTTNYKCKSIVLKSNDGEPIAIEGLLVQFENDTPVINGTQSGSPVITMTGKDGADIEAGTYYIAVRPCTLSKGFNLSFTNVYQNKTWTKSTSKSVEFKRSKTLNLGEIDIKSQLINPLGQGTAADPYLIHDYDELNYIAGQTNSGTGLFAYYKQVNDIDCENKSITPIGSPSQIFEGTYDGGGHKICNPRLGLHEYSNNEQLGSTAISSLFGVVKNAEIKNLSVELSGRFDCYTQPNGTRESMICSPLVGLAISSESKYTTISNCTVSGLLPVNNHAKIQYIGGIIGCAMSNLKISNCSNNASLSSATVNKVYVGGIIGAVYGGNYSGTGSLDFHSKVQISKCRNTAEVQSSCSNGDEGAGGIIGFVVDGTYDVDLSVYSCANYGYVHATYVHAGGIIGKLDCDGHNDNPLVFNCLNRGPIRGEFNCGGIVGWCYDDDTTVYLCANNIYPTCNMYAAIIGYAHYESGDHRTGTIQYCYDYSSASQLGGNPKKYVSSGKGSTVEAWVTWANNKLDNGFATALPDEDARQLIARWKVVDGCLDLDF